ncbi:hypothetical protein BCR35DRAFT_348808 [Leucosporidium creatinivorum]|uniref:F-box domain-containing protein n=1 Tax=Leucosporidium creatinivorum TaxID=106004 RepID=A0A1Y2G385_9BASI|nr:hypothetical protein BCR35DRAFT_348808 [Leucosporidium creatinivorum]
MLSYDGDDEARFDLSWVVVSTKTLLKLTLESVTLKGTSDTLPPFLTLTSLTLRDCTVSPPLTPFLPSLFPSLRSLTLRPTPDTSFHLIQAVLVPFAPQLDSLTWSPSPKATAENGSARAEDGLLLAMLSLCTSLSYLGIPISTLRHLNAGQLPPSLKRLRLRLSRTGDEAKEVLSAVKKLPSTVEVVEMALCGWMSARAGEELLQEVRRRVAGRVRLRHVVGD